MALIFLILGIVLVFSIQESHSEENTLDKWDPLTPSTLNPQNLTGWAYMVSTPDGTFLKLNVSASETVRLRIGFFTIDEVTGKKIWRNLIFNQTGTRFTQKVAITGTDADYLEIENEGTGLVNISGNIKKIGNIYQTIYSYSSLGTLVMLVGLISLIYGILTKPNKRHPKRKARKTRSTKRERARID
jgi:hypothetical protein